MPLKILKIRCNLSLIQKLNYPSSLALKSKEVGIQAAKTTTSMKWATKVVPSNDNLARKDLCSFPKRLFGR